MKDRKYDVVVMGASGFTGRWVAKHLLDQYEETDLAWAIAGRNQDKLESLAEFLGLNGESMPDIVLADSADKNSLCSMAAATKVVISTVGPYALYGSLLVEACVEQGTDYVDLTGEVPWMRRMIDKYADQATKTGARIVHSCGFDSVPSDMGVFFTQQQAFEKFDQYLSSIQYHLMETKGGVSGGTIASLLNVVKEAMRDKSIGKLLANPYSLNPDPSFKGVDGREQSKVIYSDDLQTWTTPFVMASINTRIVRRTNALLDFIYGENFSYNETMVTGSGSKGYMSAKIASAVNKSITFLGISKFGRKILGGILPAQGEGPEIDPDNPGFYKILFLGKTDAGELIQSQLYGDADPGYGSTSKMLAESAVCLALDDITTDGGFWTPASAMGNALLKRLQDNAGLTFTMVE